MASRSTEKTDRKWGASVASLLIVVAGVLPAALFASRASAATQDCTVAQSAPNAVVGSFEIDGNLCVNSTGNTDWSATSAQPIATDPTGSADLSAFTGGAQESGWPWPASQTNGTNPPTNADINHVYATSQIVGGHVFAYFGWDRLASTGTAAFFVELNQKTNLTGPVPDRSDGDLRLRFRQQGSATMTLDQAYVWEDTTVGTTRQGIWHEIGNAGYVAAVNQGTIPTLPGLSTGQLTAGRFSEVAIDLTQLFSTVHECGGTYGTLNLRSSGSGNPADPSVNDWIAPVAVALPPTCASVVVDKQWIIDGRTYLNAPPADFGATLTLQDPTGTRHGLDFGTDYGERSDGTLFQKGDPIDIQENVTLPPECTNSSGGDRGEHTLPTASINHFTVTNTVACPPGSLAVTKTITGDGAGQQSAVIIRVLCGGAPLEPDFVIPAGATGSVSHVFDNIPGGTQCTAVEIDDGSNSAVTSTITGDSQTVTVNRGETATIGIGDEFTLRPGLLTVSKLISGAAANQHGDIRIHAACVRPGGPSFAGDFAIPGSTGAGRLSHTFTGIPGGSVCTVTEPVDGSSGTVSVDTTPITQDVTVPAGETVAAEEIRDAFTPAPGSLTVTKTITGASTARDPITIHIGCDSGLNTSFTIPVGVSDPQPQTFTNIPAGSKCTVSETADGSNTATSVHVVGIPREVTIEAGADSNVAVSDEFAENPGSLIVSKLFAGEAAGSQGAVTIAVACTLGGAPSFSDTVTFPARTAAGVATHAFSDIPAGSVCSVTEPETGAVAGTVTVTTEGVPQSGINIPAGGVVRAAQITNTFSFVRGDLVVTKTIAGPAAAEHGGITISVECGANTPTPNTFDIPAGVVGPAEALTHTFAGIPAGSQCTVSEIADGATTQVAVVVTGSNQALTIQPGATNTIGIGDTFTPRTGSLTVRKLISGGAAGSQGTITLHASCTRGGAPSFAGDFTLPAGTAAGEHTHSFTGVPAGSSCEITEPSTGAIPGTVTVVTTNIPQTIAVPGADEVTANEVSDTYEFEPGSLLVTKTISGPLAGLQGEIVISVECGGVARPDLTIPAGATGTQTMTYADIPAGQRCAVTETENGHTANVDVIVSGGGTVTIQPGAQSAITLDNLVENAPAGSLVVTKSIGGAAAGSQGTVTINVTCSNGAGQDFAEDFTIPAGASGEQSHMFTAIPAGSTCVVTETDTGAIAGTVTVTTTGSPQTIDIPANAGTQADPIVNDYQFVRGSLLVSKTLTGDASGGQGQITLRTECDGVALTPDLVVPAGTSAGTVSHTYPSVTGNSRCTVTELESGSTAGVTVNITGAGETVTVPPGGSATLAVTDTVDPIFGSLVVDKLIAGRAAGSQDEITIAVTCTLGGESSFAGTFTIPAGALTPLPFEHVFTEIPSGSSCTVAEPVNGSNATASATVTITGSPAVIPPSDSALINVLDTYEYVPGQVTVSKTIVGSAASEQGVVRLRTVCDGAAQTPDLVVPAGSAPGTYEQTYTGVPGNAVCAVTELESGATADVSVIIDGDGAQSTVPPNGSTTLDLTDTFNPVPGALDVEKLMAGPAAAAHGPITIQVVCTRLGIQSFADSFTIPAGTTVPFPYVHRFELIPGGSSCLVTETADGHIGTVTATVTITGSPAVVTSGATSAVHVADDFEWAPGSLTVSKTITGPRAGQQDQAALRTVCDGVTLTPDLLIPAGHQAGTVSHTYTGVPGNALCTVTEIADGSNGQASVTITGDGASVTVPPAGSDSLTVTNRYDPAPASLIVRKLIGGPALGVQGPVTIDVNCTLDGEPSFTGDFTVPAGATAPAHDKEFTGIPSGSTCTVSESADGSTDTVSNTIYAGRPQSVDIPDALQVSFVERADIFTSPHAESAPGLPQLPATGMESLTAVLAILLAAVLACATGAVLYLVVQRSRRRSSS